MAERTKNLGQALFSGLSAGAGYMAENHGKGTEQKNQNTLAAMTMMLQQQQAQRAQLEHAQKIAMGRIGLQNANIQLKKAIEESALTPEQIGQRRAAEKIAEAQKYASEMAPQLNTPPEGWEYAPQVPGFTLNKLPTEPTKTMPSFNDNLLYSQLGPQRYAEYLIKKGTVAKDPQPKQLDADDQKLYDLIGPEAFGKFVMQRDLMKKGEVGGKELSASELRQRAKQKRDDMLKPLVSSLNDKLRKIDSGLYNKLYEKGKMKLDDPNNIAYVLDKYEIDDTGERDRELYDFRFFDDDVLNADDFKIIERIKEIKNMPLDELIDMVGGGERPASGDGGYGGIDFSGMSKEAIEYILGGNQ
jgi:hypothetical protein